MGLGSAIRHAVSSVTSAVQQVTDAVVTIGGQSTTVSSLIEKAKAKQEAMKAELESLSRTVPIDEIKAVVDEAQALKSEYYDPLKTEFDAYKEQIDEIKNNPLIKPLVEMADEALEAVPVIGEIYVAGKTAWEMQMEVINYAKLVYETYGKKEEFEEFIQQYPSIENYIAAILQDTSEANIKKQLKLALELIGADAIKQKEFIELLKIIFMDAGINTEYLDQVLVAHVTGGDIDSVSLPPVQIVYIGWV